MMSKLGYVAALAAVGAAPFQAGNCRVTGPSPTHLSLVPFSDVQVQRPTTSFRQAGSPTVVKFLADGHRHAIGHYHSSAESHVGAHYGRGGSGGLKFTQRGLQNANAAEPEQVAAAESQPQKSGDEVLQQLGFQSSGKFFAENFKKIADNEKSNLQSPTAPLREDAAVRLPPDDTFYKRRKVLVTGLGVVSGVGIGLDEFWQNLVDGVGACQLLKDTPEEFSCRAGCPVNSEQFKAKDWYKNKADVSRSDRHAHFAMAAAKMAVKDGNLDINAVDHEKFGVLIGSGIGGINWTTREVEHFLEKPKKVNPLIVPAMILNVSPGSVAVDLNARGPNFAVVTACASGTHSIGEAMRLIQHGDADIVLAGGSEATLNNFTLNGFNRLGATARGWNNQADKASRPFDLKRSGFVMGEGAGVLLLESEEHALRRSAKIYGELAGYGSSCDAYHMTAPRADGSGLTSAMRKAIEEARVAKEDIGYINAHGTSTPLNDKIETLAIKNFFGAALASNILISSTKSMTGHCLGAAGGIEAVASVKALETGIAPPTINYENPDPECDLFYCPNKKVVKEAGFTAVMSNSLGFGGQNAVLVMKKYHHPTSRS